MLNERGRNLEDSDSARKGPLSILKFHTARVSKALYALTGNTSTSDNNGEMKSYSCGFDPTDKFWDTEYGVCDHTIVILSSFLL